jgi:hypothetical protein
VKTTLGEYRKFCNALPECYYFEESEDDYDDTTDDATEITLSGWIAWQGRQIEGEVGVLPGIISAKERNDIVYEGETISVAALFRRWRKAQTTVRLVVEVDKSKEAQLRALLAGLDAKIV